VIEVPTPASGCLPAELGPSRNETSSDRAQSGVPLSNIMEQGWANEVLTRISQDGDVPGRLETMALVEVGLRKEQIDLRRMQPNPHFALLDFGQRRSSKNSHKPGCQVPPTAQQRTARSAQDNLFLQLTQRTDSGRASMRAGSIGFPQLAQIPYLP
jgi:hypothetical protein